MKICSRCEQEKPKIEFVIDKRKKEGIGSHCKKCETARKKKEKEDNLEHFKILAKKSRKKNKEKIKEKQKKYHEENKEKINERQRKTYQENRENIRDRQNKRNKTEEARKKNNERQKKWSKENRDERNKIMKKWLSKNRDKVNEWHLQWREKNKEKARAQRMIRDHVRRGNLERGTKCQICATEQRKIEAHHTDYSKPLEVMWLCRICHMHQHGKLLDVKP